jgi:lipoate-protein ligase A
VHFLDLTLPTLEENLALDEALLLGAEAGERGEILRLWEWPKHAVVLGAGGKLSEDVVEDACNADAVPIQRRASGGGTVLLGRGCLLFSLILDYEREPSLRDIHGSYRYILGRLAGACAQVLPGAEPAGTSDLAANGRKFSGNAQQRKRLYLLHHGTLLYDFDPAQLGRYLRMPVRQPEYRGQRTHDAFVRNLPATAAELRQLVCRTWGAHEPVTTWPREQVRRLVAEKYSREDWVRRR